MHLLIAVECRCLMTKTNFMSLEKYINMRDMNHSLYNSLMMYLEFLIKRSLKSSQKASIIGHVLQTCMLINVNWTFLFSCNKYRQWKYFNLEISAYWTLKSIEKFPLNVHAKDKRSFWVILCFVLSCLYCFVPTWAQYT